jgi:hypothetical protein
VVRAPVVGSGAAPACTASVSNPGLALLIPDISSEPPHIVPASAMGFVVRF